MCVHAVHAELAHSMAFLLNLQHTSCTGVFGCSIEGALLVHTLRLRPLLHLTKQAGYMHRSPNHLSQTLCSPHNHSRALTCRSAGLAPIHAASQPPGSGGRHSGSPPADVHAPLAAAGPSGPPGTAGVPPGLPGHVGAAVQGHWAGAAASERAGEGKAKGRDCRGEGLDGPAECAQAKGQCCQGAACLATKLGLCNLGTERADFVRV